MTLTYFFQRWHRRTEETSACYPALTFTEPRGELDELMETNETKTWLPKVSSWVFRSYSYLVLLSLANQTGICICGHETCHSGKCAHLNTKGSNLELLLRAPLPPPTSACMCLSLRTLDTKDAPGSLALEIGSGISLCRARADAMIFCHTYGEIGNICCRGEKWRTEEGGMEGRRTQVCT